MNARLSFRAGSRNARTWDRRARRRLPLAAAVGLALAGLAVTAPAARAQTATLGATDFTLAMARPDPASSGYITLDAAGLASYFSAARCACPATIGVGIGLDSDGVAKLTSSDALDVTLMLGPACDDPSATGCITVGQTLSLSASTTSATETVSTTVVFSAVLGSASCSTLPSTSTRLWAIVRDNGVLIASQPSLSIAFGGTPPAAPTAVTLLTADSGLAVSWTASGDSTTLQGHQVLCLPGPTNPPAAAYEICAAAPPATGTGPFASLAAAFVCSSLIPIGTTTTRVRGLTNGTPYQVAVIAIGNDGTPSAPSDAATETPGPTLGIDDIYKESGGTAAAGCAVAGEPRRGQRRGRIADAGMLLVLLLLGGLAVRASPRRRGRRRAEGKRGSRGGVLLLLLPLLAFSATMAGGGVARATDDELNGFIPDLDTTPIGPPLPSPRNWNLELRFSPYRPDVDGEFADRGDTARPFSQVFSSSRHLLSGVELDRQVSHRGGTWGVGLGSGYYRVSAASLAADHVTRTGDETSLRLIPLSLSAVYRADTLRERSGFPLVPYAKLGLDCMFWSMSDTSKSSTFSGQTFGWHAAAGLSLDLSFLDPEGVRTMDIESGVNQFALFFEVATYQLSGFGASDVLHVGDTTWIAGAMFEL